MNCTRTTYFLDNNTSRYGVFSALWLTIFALRSLCVSDDYIVDDLDDHMFLCNAKARIIIIIIIIITSSIRRLFFDFDFDFWKKCPGFCWKGPGFWLFQSQSPAQNTSVEARLCQNRLLLWDFFFKVDFDFEKVEIFQLVIYLILYGAFIRKLRRKLSYKNRRFGLISL